MSKFSILKEFYDFLRQRKKMWLIPLVIFLILLGFLIFSAQGSVLAPFVYTLF